MTGRQDKGSSCWAELPVPIGRKRHMLLASLEQEPIQHPGPPLCHSPVRLHSTPTPQRGPTWATRWWWHITRTGQVWLSCWPCPPGWALSLPSNLVVCLWAGAECHVRLENPPPPPGRCLGKGHFYCITASPYMLCAGPRLLFTLRQFHVSLCITFNDVQENFFSIVSKYT